jgi:hypothetical protein
MNDPPDGKNIINKKGEGAYGKVYKGKVFIYKAVETDNKKKSSDPDKLENFYREIFLESWLQTILSSDKNTTIRFVSLYPLKEAVLQGRAEFFRSNNLARPCKLGWAFN